MIVNFDWKDRELVYCLNLVAKDGDDFVGHNPDHILSYLKLQATDAHRDGEYGNAAILEKLAWSYEQ